MDSTFHVVLTLPFTPTGLPLSNPQSETLRSKSLPPAPPPTIIIIMTTAATLFLSLTSSCPIILVSKADHQFGESSIWRIILIIWDPTFQTFATQSFCKSRFTEHWGLPCMYREVQMVTDKAENSWVHHRSQNNSGFPSANIFIFTSFSHKYSSLLSTHTGRSQQAASGWHLFSSCSSSCVSTF